MRTLGETATARIVETSSLKRFIAASRRLLEGGACDRCKTAPATTTNGAGRGWCAACSAAELAQRRAGFERAAACRRQIEIARAKR